VTTKKLIREFSTIFSSEVLLLAASFISFPILARLLSKEDYGFMSLVTMSLMLVANVASGGLNNSVLRYFGKYVEKIDRIVFVNSLRLTTLVLSLLAMSGFVIISVIASSLGSLQTGFISVLLISSLLIPIRALTRIELSFLRISEHVMLMNSFNLLIRYGGIAAGIGLIYRYKALSALYVGTIVAEVLVLVVIYIVISTRMTELAFRPLLSKEQVKEAFSYGLPLAVSGLLTFFLSSTDRYVIGYFLSAESVADYTVAINFCNYPIEILRNVYLATFVPLIMNSWNRTDEGEVNTQNLTNFIASYFWLAVPVVCGLIMTDVEGIKLLAGNRYAAVPYLTPLMATSFALNGMNFVFIAGLLYKKRTKLVLYLNVITGFFNLILNLILVPSIGIYGAAIASLTSYTIFIVIASCLSRKEMSFAVPLKDIVLSVSAGVFMLVMYKIVSSYGVVKFTLAIKVCVGIISYAAFVLLFAKSRVRTLTNAFKPSAVAL